MEDLALQPLNWMEILEVGVPEIDDDHQALLRECNELLALARAKSDWPAIVAAARRLTDHCVEHFRLEEGFLAETGFPRVEDHIRQHGQIAQQLKDTLLPIENADATEHERLSGIEKLRAALVDILLRHDLDYKSHLLVSRGK